MSCFACWGVFISLIAVPAVTAGELASGTAPASNLPVSAKAASRDPVDLTGQGIVEVQSALGKPMGKLQTGAGALWLYPEWKIQFDARNRVVKVERDAPVRATALDPQWAARLNAGDQAARARAAAEDAARIKARAGQESAAVRIVSNDGAAVDLPSLLVSGKVTIVDFFATWCGPCRQISPVLEKMAKDDPSVTLLKIDIVNWDRPVVKQFNISAVPNMVVFNGNKQPVGAPTSDVNAVAQYVRQAKGK